MSARHLLLPLIAAVLTLAGAPAFALTGATGVRVVAHCGDDDSSVTINTDPGLHGSMLVTGDAANIQGPPGGVGEASVELACRSDAALTLTIPRDAAFHVQIDGIGSTSWHLGDIPSHLDAALRGSGDLEAGALTGGFEITSYAGGDVSIDHAAGDVGLHGRGSGDFAVRTITAGRLLVEMMGSGDVAVSAGTIGTLEVQSRGSSDVKIGADAQTADLSTFGSGDISVARVAGQVTQSHAGSGDITIGGRKTGDHVAITWDENASHDVVITDGAGHTGHVPGSIAVGVAHALRTFFHIVLLVLGIGLVVAFVRVLRRHRRGMPSRLAAVAAATRPADPRVAELGALMSRLAGRASRLETLVTSKEFELHRGFRELGD